MTARTQDPRGQALLETALGVVIFVGAFGLLLHLFEIGYVSLKVQESGAEAAWDISGRSLRASKKEEVQRFGKKEIDPAIAQGIVTTSTTRSQAKYANFDGRASAAAGTELTQLATRASDLSLGTLVTLEKFEDPIACIQKSVPAPGLIDKGTKIILTSSATVNVEGLPDSISGTDGNGLLFGGGSSLGARTLCGIGRTFEDGCRGKMYMVVDDWSVHLGYDCSIKDGKDCDNPEYYEAVKDIFDSYTPIGGEASAFAQAVVGASPIDERKFYFSSRHFTETEGPGGEGKTDWDTGPGPAERPKCFLGIQCP